MQDIAQKRPDPSEVLYVRRSYDVLYLGLFSLSARWKFTPDLGCIVTLGNDLDEKHTEYAS